ncbi:MAG: type II toxin-antitoxin system VapC family toxin [Rhodospirillaceae bacterium]|nr:type II toxin-antitoxin system VapC family toxin [Rhodospirillaceae bacterium]
MIAFDTSALMAILLQEPETAACTEALVTDDQLVVSAVTVVEALVVAERRGLGSEMAGLIDGLALDVVSVSPTVAKRVVESYAQWGRGMNPAGLNFGDCFAYEVAKARDCPLLYAGTDFARTDIVSVL